MGKFKVKNALLCATAILFGAASVSAGTVFVSADVSPALCEVGGVSYRFFGEGLSAWKEGTTLKLLENISLSGLLNADGTELGLDSISVTESKTLDLNGKTLRGTGSGSVLTVEGAGVEFTLCDASAEKGGTLTGGDADYGGGIKIKGATVKISDVSVSGNEAFIGGGGISAEGGADLTVSHALVENNAATFGGGILLNESSLTLDATVKGNTASITGGGINVYGNGSSVTMTGGAIEGNRAELNGGGVAVRYGAVYRMTGGTIEGNSAGWEGGGVEIYGSDTVKGTFLLESGTVSGNSGNYGGGIHIAENGVLEMAGGNVSGNEAVLRGGGIYIKKGGHAAFGKQPSVEGNLSGGGKSNVFVEEKNLFTVESPGKIGFSMEFPGILAENYGGDVGELTSDRVGYEIAVKGGTLSLEALAATGIEITKMPDKTEYQAGENFDPTGMIVTVTYSDGSREDVTGYAIEGGDGLSAESQEVKISYTSPRNTVRASVPVKVTPAEGPAKDGLMIGLIIMAITAAIAVFMITFAVVKYKRSGR